MPYVWRSIAVSLQPGSFFLISMPSTIARVHLSNGVNGCQETPWSEEFTARNSTERLVASAIWSCKDPSFPGTS